MGKTTISWYACQLAMAKGLNMFQKFEFVIHLSLANPRIQSVASFEDLVPHPSAEVCIAIAKAIIELRGNKCFATTVQVSSFLTSIIQGNAPEIGLAWCSFG